MWPAHRRDLPFRDRHNGRGLCGGCYQNVKRAGELADYPLAGKRTEDAVKAWARMQRQGLTRKQAARRLGMRTNTLTVALCRARRRAA